MSLLECIRRWWDPYPPCKAISPEIHARCRLGMDHQSKHTSWEGTTWERYDK